MKQQLWGRTVRRLLSRHITRWLFNSCLALLPGIQSLSGTASWDGLLVVAAAAAVKIAPLQMIKLAQSAKLLINQLLYLHLHAPAVDRCHIILLIPV
jgi:hypothetical protein